MKKHLSFFLVLLIAVGAAYASITLTNQIVLTVGGVTTETDTQAGVSEYTISYASNAQSLTFYIQQGTVSGQVVNRGAVAPIIAVNVDLVSGKFSSSNGVSGTLTGGQLTTVNNALKTNRNALETFAINQGIVAGTQVSW